MDALQLAAFAALGLLALFATPAFVDHRHERRTLLSGLGESPLGVATADPAADNDAVDDAADDAADEGDGDAVERTADAEELTEHDRVEYPPDETDEG